MIKKNPSYRVTVTYWNETLQKYESEIIEYPITCKFNSVRGTFSLSNKCIIELYNLSESTRTNIFKDALVGDLEEKQWKFIKLEAGWNGQLSQIFYGRILQAYSSKESGQVDVITRIECLPFDIYDSYSSHTFAAGTSKREAYKTIATDLKNCQFGNLGQIDGNYQTQTTFDGKTLDCLNQITGNNTFVDNGVLNTLLSNEVIDIPVPLITDENGLLATPIRRGGSLVIKTLFEPTLIVGQLLEIHSKIAPMYDGQYKVLGFTHDCLISPTQAGQRISTINLWVIPALTGSDINLSNAKVTGGAAKVQGETVTPITPTPLNPKWIMPCKGKITGFFGEDRPGHTHNGIDIYTGTGTPVKAIAAGKVVVSGAADGYGRWVGIDHGVVNGIRISSEYGHLSRELVSQGAIVKQGQIIAYSGNTGRSSAPHVHLTIRHGSPGREGGKAVDPFIYVDKNKY